MPYKVKGKCVYKKDTNEKVGCTKGSVKKYLTALRMNAESINIRKIIREAINKDLCDTLTINTINDIKKLSVHPKLSEKQKAEIKSILKKIRDDQKKYSEDYDVIDTYFHDIQTIVCQ